MSKPEKKMAIITPVFRVSFPHLVTAQPPMDPTSGSDPKFGLMAIFEPRLIVDPKEKERWKDIMADLNRACIKKFAQPLASMPANFKRPWHKGDEKPQYGMTADMVFFNLTSKLKPQMMAADGKTIITDGSKFYPGCYARASVNGFGFKNRSSGVALGLGNLKFIKDGERLDNRLDATVEFEDLGDETPEDDGSMGTAMDEFDALAGL